jgi:hypothetical protein
MKKYTSALTMAVLGTVLTIGSATASMARDAGHRPLSLEVRCPRGIDNQGFGGFSGAKGHPFNLGHDYGKGQRYEDNWDYDPFWTPDTYSGGYDGVAYIAPEPNEPLPYMLVASKPAGFGKTGRRCP